MERWEQGRETSPLARTVSSLSASIAHTVPAELCLPPELFLSHIPQQIVTPRGELAVGLEGCISLPGRGGGVEVPSL